MENKYTEIVKILKESKNTVVLTGAGISTMSGIPDFRSSNGIYSTTPEVALSKGYFLRNTEKFYKFFKEFFEFNKFKPNIAHEILARWEEEGYISSIITQNVDNLHQLAGSKNVLNIHGNVDTGTCLICGNNYPQKEYLEDYRCECGGLIKPDIVLYDENVPLFSEAINRVSNCDCLLVLGTSLVVYPVASLIEYIPKNSKIIIINYTDTPYTNSSKVISIKDEIGKTLTEIDSRL
jgi:NAD-dependent deacetylase